MAKMKFRAPVTGVETWKYKTGTTGGGFGDNPAAQPSGAALTITDANELGLAGANDPVDRILDSVNVNTGQCRVFNPNVGEIEGIITDGTVTVGRSIIGHSDTDRGKAVSVPAAPSATQAAAARWVVRSSSAGKANIVPRG